jgi:hypothetical protein
MTVADSLICLQILSFLSEDVESWTYMASPVIGKITDRKADDQ